MKYGPLKNRNRRLGTNSMSVQDYIYKALDEIATFCRHPLPLSTELLYMWMQDLGWRTSANNPIRYLNQMFYKHFGRDGWCRRGGMWHFD